MFPLGDDNSQRRTTPYVVWTFVGINVLFWLAQLGFGESFTYGWAAIPFEITRNVDLVQAQMVEFAGQTIEIPQAPGPVPIHITVLTAMFMHGSWMHIIGNMLYLLIFGDQIEDILGHGRFILFYLLCGIGASLAHIAFASNSVVPSLGASTGVAYMAHIGGFAAGAVLIFLMAIGRPPPVPARQKVMRLSRRR